jgi:hypothetical protein
VIDYLGTATPHGNFWLAFFLAFAAAMTAMRVIVGWVYMHTGSVLLAQLLHAVSTGSLVVFSPPNATAGQEAFWYAVYACMLWLAVGGIRAKLSGEAPVDASPANSLLAYLATRQGKDAAAEFQRILDHRSILIGDPIGALSYLQLGRALAMAGDTAKARPAYGNFLALWKNADTEIPILKQAKAEYAKLLQ